MVIAVPTVIQTAILTPITLATAVTIAVKALPESIKWIQSLVLYPLFYFMITELK